MSNRRWLRTNLSSNVLLGVIGLASSSVAGWAFGPEGRGELAAIQVTAAFVGLLAAGGMPEAAVFLISRRRDDDGVILGTAFRMVLAVSFAVTVIAVPLVLYLFADYSHATRNVALALLCLSPVVAVTALWHQALRGMQRSTAWNGVRVLGAVIWLVAIVSIAIVGAEASITGLVYAALLIPLAAITYRFVRNARQNPARNDRSRRSEIIRFGLPSVAASIPLYLNLRLDQLILTKVVTPEELGLYAAAVGLTWAVNPPLQAIASLSFPAVASIDDPIAKQAQFARITRLAIPVCVATALAVGLIVPFAVPVLFGPEFDRAIPIALILVGATTVFAYTFILEEAARGMGLPRVALIGQGVGLIAAIAAMWLLIPGYGIRGAAWASVAGYGAACLVDLLQLRHQVTRSLSDLVLTTPQDIKWVLRAVRSPKPTAR